MSQSFMATSSGRRSTITLMVETGSFTETVVGDSEIHEFTPVSYVSIAINSNYCKHRLFATVTYEY